MKQTLSVALHISVQQTDTIIASQANGYLKNPFLPMKNLFF